MMRHDMIGKAEEAVSRVNCAIYLLINQQSEPLWIISSDSTTLYCIGDTSILFHITNYQLLLNLLHPKTHHLTYITITVTTTTTNSNTSQPHVVLLNNSFFFILPFVIRNVLELFGKKV